jgi:hypothetical protein
MLGLKETSSGGTAAGASAGADGDANKETGFKSAERLEGAKTQIAKLLTVCS